MPDNLLMPEGSDPYYGQKYMPSGQELRAYQPTWRDRLGAWFMGDEKTSPERNRLMEGLLGSRGLGETGPSAIDFTPAGIALGVNDAWHKGDDKALAMALIPGAPKGVGAVENGTAKAARNASQELEDYLKQNLGVFSANAPYTPKPRQLDPNAPTSLNDLDAMVRAAFGKKPDEPVSVEPPGIRAYHGSPHDFDKFDMSRIGTGEGAQAYGPGLYFAEAEDVAKQYRKNLSAADGGIDQIAQTLAKQAGGWDKARQKFEGELLGRAQKMRDAGLKYDLPDYDVATLQALRKGEPGRLYEVRINANPDDFLDWDKPLSQQSEKVRGAFEKAVPDRYKGITSDDEVIAGEHYRNIFHENDNRVYKTAFRRMMNDEGVPGIRYLDQGSRYAGEGSRNYVVFRDDIIDIVKKYGIAAAASMYGLDAVNQAMGAVQDQPQNLLMQGY